MLAARIMQHIPERANANQLPKPFYFGSSGVQRTRRATYFARITMIFTIICVVGLVGSFVATAHAIWVRGI